tara:strand:+ start:937 stop:1578 length:642 start_codon:yes stop_codon:yes gene_type:complete
MIIAIDGISGSGKSTTAKRLAKELDFFHIDSGSLYRVATYFCIINKIKSDDKDIELKLDKMNIILGNNKILLNDLDVTSEIREHYISDSVSDYSSNPIIRNKLSDFQRELAENRSVVVEGRDIATHVFPSADYKFYLTADAMVRTERRYKQMLESNNSIDKESILKNLIKRDQLDMNREHSPLLKDDAAIEIDTTDLSIDEQVNLIIKTINKE